jgi:glycosyltransferase involved in cell wall biosynthesis
MSEHRLLYFCDFPPSNFAGGPVLVKRLLEDDSDQTVTVLTGSHYLRSAPVGERLACRHLVFPTSNETGRWGIGRLKSLIDWLLIPLLALFGAWVIKRNNLRVIVTVADGHFFIAAMCASVLTRAPLVLIVHDDWVTAQKVHSYVLRLLCSPLFRLALRRASHIYAVSPGMQRMLKEEFEAEAELQLPSTEVRDVDSFRNNQPSNSTVFQIVYAGIASGAVLEGLDTIAQLIKSGKLSESGLGSCQLNLYMAASRDDLRRLGWEHENIKLHGWVTQHELKHVLKNADALFLPYSFREDQRFFISRSFPSKVADYLAAGKPILIRSPSYASVVEYACRYGFAEIVDDPSEDALVKGILRIWKDQSYREALVANGKRTLNLNHDIAAQRSAFKRLISDLTSGLSSAAAPNVLVPNK